MINIRIKNNNQIIEKKFSSNITTLEIIKKENLTFLTKPVAAFLDNQLIDINKILTKDGFLKIITEKDQKGWEILNHSTAHLMAQAIKRIFPKSLLVQDYVSSEGFFCDIDFQNNNASVKDFTMIEEKMNQIIKENLNITRKEINLKEAFKLFINNPYKKETLEKIYESFVSIYIQGEFSDLCQGPHLINTNLIKYFKILKISGSYFKGDLKNKVLTRIYGISFFNYSDLLKYLNDLDERKERDHKNINKKHNFFMFSSQVGLGLPFWLEKGATIRRIIERYIVDKEIENDYQHVYTPILANTELYKISGHLELYHENMFPVMHLKNKEELILRPMNCPHHMMIFKKKLHSYKDLPIKIAELGMMHRYEHSGAVSGLQRTREMTLNDAHIFLTETQIKEEFINIISLILEVYKDFNIKQYFFNLSTRDVNNKHKYFNDDLMWDKAESILKEILKKQNISFQEKVGEAAFYGPKLDIQVLTALGNEETLSTIQLDFLLPKRFNLSFIGEDNQLHDLIVIHRAIISTMERFVAFLIEQNKAVFPLWLAPIQAVLIPINNQYHLSYALKIKKILLNKNIRTELNNKNETLNYKIRVAQKSKIPFQIVIGDQEVNNQTITFRKYGSKETNKNIKINDFIKIINILIKNKK
ncbi:threonine--tRNA ligase [Candidatus Phytoplasma oryzae]|uniref:Threonine--tRNA ligase n=1 Tax=Candidatus Phytoplasma oryzae TaxID=203274 RepID=A0A139JQP3_9MOLU|nr:threonine--tRNA ligase [Candidatus Phytoplasma oryzae]KXT29301.1 threonine--tRNA ligase [Candidatus Phytoplasma oryzae]RAM57568.1 threonyl-tRNA synthase [Candidatus Phytoplasma oryzae]